MICLLLIDCLEHVGFRNLLQGGAGRLPCLAYRHRASRRCSFAAARSGQGQILPFDCGLVDDRDGLRARRRMARDVVPQRGFYSGGRISGRLGACAARFPAAGVIEAPKMAAKSRL
ncbi:MAG: hypothetical protein WCA23_19725 [Stellaceae bacterium]